LKHDLRDSAIERSFVEARRKPRTGLKLLAEDLDIPGRGG